MSDAASRWVEVTWKEASLELEAYLDEDDRVVALGQFRGVVPFEETGQAAKCASAMTALFVAVAQANVYLTVPAKPGADAKRPCVSLQDLSIVLSRGRNPDAFTHLVGALARLERQVAAERRSAVEALAVEVSAADVARGLMDKGIKDREILDHLFIQQGFHRGPDWLAELREAV